MRRGERSFVPLARGLQRQEARADRCFFEAASGGGRIAGRWKIRQEFRRSPFCAPRTPNETLPYNARASIRIPAQMWRRAFQTSAFGAGRAIPFPSSEFPLRLLGEIPAIHRENVAGDEVRGGGREEQ